MISIGELLVVAGSVIGIAAATAALGLGAVRLLSGRSLATLLTVVAAVTIVASLAGVVVAAVGMFISAKDRDVVLTVVATAGVAGFAVAILVGREITKGNRLLLGSVRTIGATGRYTPPARRLPAEFTAVSTELTAVSERLAQARQREQTLEASRRELVAWVSHDLRAPLAGLRAMAEALEDEVVVDEQTVRAYHAQIRREADRLSAMIDDLFELSRIHAGALRLYRRQVGLDGLVAEVLASTEPLARAKGVRLTGSASAAAPVCVDPAEFGRALRNLVVNAIRHTPSDSPVEVFGRIEGDRAQVSVSDTCGGIPADALPRVFDMAYRGESARTPGPAGGAGLGLSIARGIVEAHAGRIAVRNKGAGCQFVIQLPLTAAGCGPALLSQRSVTST